MREIEVFSNINILMADKLFQFWNTISADGNLKRENKFDVGVIWQ